MKMLWINTGFPTLPEVARYEFDRVCEVREIDASELDSHDAAESWDLICFNFDFPDMAGLKLVSHTKDRSPSTPIILLTLQGSSELALWALRSRVFDVLEKPVSAEEVARCLQRIRIALDARSAQNERKPFLAAPLPAAARYEPRLTINQRLQGAVAHVAKHYARPIHEAEVAAICHLSPSRFCTEFSAAFGVTFVDYLAQYRVELAKRLMPNQRMLVADVAAAVGFSDPAYFSRVFRRLEGVSPSEYRLVEAAQRVRPGSTKELVGVTGFEPATYTSRT